jgi:hypothetical protein
MVVDMKLDQTDIAYWQRELNKLKARCMQLEVDLSLEKERSANVVKECNYFEALAVVNSI